MPELCAWEVMCVNLSWTRKESKNLFSQAHICAWVKNKCPRQCYACMMHNIQAQSFVLDNKASVMLYQRQEHCFSNCMSYCLVINNQRLLCCGCMCNALVSI